MPILLEMTWCSNQTRWFKKYLNKRYSISPRQLRKAGYPADDTMSGSRAAANAWWQARKAAIDKANVIYSLDTRRELFPVEVPKQVLHLYTAEQLADRTYFADETGALYRNQRLVGISEAGRAVVADRIERQRMMPIDQTIGEQLDEYYNSKVSQSKSNEFDEKSLAPLKTQLRFIGKVLGRENPISTINGQAVSKVYQALCEIDASPWTKKGNFGKLKTWIRWLWDTQGVIEELPRNLTKKDMKFVAVGKPEPLEINVVRELLATANDETKLYMRSSGQVGPVQRTKFREMDRALTNESTFSLDS
jgi:hypothetical protein